MIAIPVSAIEWTYYDLDDQILNDPTEKEIEENAVMRVSDTGVTQYSLEIEHDFSGTWGTGYLENIGNPMPGVGKHWMNINEDVTCKVDGIVQDVYNVNSRYVANGYIAQGPPNSEDKAAALIFDGKNDYVTTNSIKIRYPSSIIIRLWAKRDRLDQEEYLFAHGNNQYGLYAGFNRNNKAVFGTYRYKCEADVPTDTGWHKWEFRLYFYNKYYYIVTGKGCVLRIYMDGVQIGYKNVEPECSKKRIEYQVNETERGCYKHSGASTGGNNESGNRDIKNCKDLIGPAFQGESTWQHHVQLCYDYDSIFWGLSYCDQCYQRGDWASESECKAYWWPKGYVSDNTWDRDRTNTRIKNYFDSNSLMRTRDFTVTKHYYRYTAQRLYYYRTEPILIGGYQSKLFQGKIKDVRMYTNGWGTGKWKLNDGNQSSVAVDSWYGRNGYLKIFDTDACWLIDPKIQKHYEFSRLLERQKVKEFKMTSPGKIVYDWGRQHAVSVNSLPENLGENISVEVNKDGTQDNHTDAGKYWYNHGSNITIRADEGGCQKLSGYKDNVADPSKIISSNYKNIKELDAPENLSWVYSPYLFEETVTIGAPVILSTIPPDLIQNIDLSKKPNFISTDANETDVCVWNDTDKRIYPLQAETSFDLEYDLLNAECDDIKVILKVKTKWPDSPHIVHVANTPPVNLDPSLSDDVTFMDIKQVENDAAVGDLKFSATQKGRAILHFKRNYIENVLPKKISLTFDGKGYVQTVDPIAFGQNFTIEFYAKRQLNGNFQTIIGHGVGKVRQGLFLHFNSSDNFNFYLLGYSLYTPSSVKTKITDYKWHHWACVYETDISGISEENGDWFINSDIFTCKNDPNNSECRWGNYKCYTKEFIGDYDSTGEQRTWNHLAKTKRQCGYNIKYIRKIYCDGELVATNTMTSPYIGQGTLRIGMRSYYNKYGGFQGQVDEVRIWNAART